MEAKQKRNFVIFTIVMAILVIVVLATSFDSVIWPMVGVIQSSAISILKVGLLILASFGLFVVPAVAGYLFDKWIMSVYPQVRSRKIWLALAPAIVCSSLMTKIILLIGGTFTPIPVPVVAIWFFELIGILFFYIPMFLRNNLNFPQDESTGGRH